jgi:hypothetical protein
MTRIAAILTLAALAGCSSSPSTTANSSNADPAVTSALADPLLADPQLDRRANRDALRPADEPYQAMVPPGLPSPLRGDAPPTIVARARLAVAGDRAGVFKTCSFDVRYSYGWAARLSPELGLPAEAQVAEAAGSDTSKCQLRLIAYSSSLGSAAMLESYRRIAKSGGYTSSEAAQGGATSLTATRKNDGAAFVATVSAGDGGSLVDLVSNRGR